MRKVDPTCYNTFSADTPPIPATTQVVACRCQANARKFKVSVPTGLHKNEPSELATAPANNIARGCQLRATAVLLAIIACAASA